MEQIEKSFETFMNQNPELTHFDIVHKENKELILFMNNVIENSPLLCQILESGTEKDMCALLEGLSANIHISSMIIALEKSMVANLKRREDLQENISIELVRWFRKGGWKFPKLDIELKNVSSNI